MLTNARKYGIIAPCKRGAIFMLNIDQRLENAYRLLVQENKNGKANAREIDKVKEAIIYLKDFSKVQEEIRLAGSRKGVHMDLETEITKLEERLEEKKKELACVPRPPRRKITGKKNSGYVGQFQEMIENQKAKEIEEKIRQIQEEKASLKMEIKELTAKIRVLTKADASIDKPKKLGELMFEEENTDLRKRYQNLLTYCENVMFQGEENDIFVKNDQGKVEKVNLLHAKRFLRKIKDRDSIMAIADCVAQKHESEQLEARILKTEEYQDKIGQALQLIDTEEMNFMVYRMNSLIGECNELLKAEEVAMKGTPIKRAWNRLRNALNIPERIKVPKKIIAMREKFSEDVSEFSLEIGKSEESKKAFEAYALIRNQGDFRGLLTITELQNVCSQLENGAHTITAFPVTLMDTKQLKESAEYFSIMYQKQLSDMKEKKAEIDGKQKNMREALSPKALKMLETENEENVLKYAQMYYGYTGGPGESNLKYTRDSGITASTAAVVLEGIIGRSAKNLSWDKFTSVYGDVLSEERMAEETATLHNAVKAKMKLFKSKIHEFSECKTGAELVKNNKKVEKEAER